MKKRPDRTLPVLGLLLLLAAAIWCAFPREAGPHPGAFFVTWPGPDPATVETRARVDGATGVRPDSQRTAVSKAVALHY